MLPHKCCQFLMRMMSPLKVGLIFTFLIVISSSNNSPDKEIIHPLTYSFHPLNYTTTPPKYFLHRPAYSIRLSNHSIHRSNKSTYPPRHFTHTSSTHQVRLSKNASLPLFAKSHKFRRTRPSMESPKSVNISSRPIFNNGSVKNIPNRNRTLPNLRLRTKIKVKNGSDVNSTIVYFPRYGRAMGNSNKSSVHKDSIPIIVSSRRRVLLDLDDYNPSSKSRSKFGTTSTVSNIQRKREISQNIRSTERPKRTRLKLKESSASSRKNKTTKFRNNPTQRFSSSTEAVISESKIFVRIRNELKNGTFYRKQSTVSQILSTLKPRNRQFRIRPPKYRRQGRNFDLDADGSTDTGESYSEMLLSKPMIEKINKTEIAKPTNPPKLFDYAYSTGIQRNYKITNWPRFSKLDSEIRTVFPTSTLIPLRDFGKSYYEKKAKNLTIYEILKPKLLSLNQINQNSSSLDPEFENQYGMKNTSEQYESTSLENNEIKVEIPPFRSSMIILPSRSDSNYGVEYVMVNRNNSAVITAIKSNETVPDENYEFGKRNNKTVIQNSSNSEKIPELQTNPETDIKPQGEIQESQIVLPTDLLRLKSEERMTARNKGVSNLTATAPFNSSGEQIRYDSSDFVTELFESDSIRKSKMAVEASPEKNLKLESKKFYDYFAKKPDNNETIRHFPNSEFRPGNMFRYSDIYNRRPILDMGIVRQTPIRKLEKPKEDMVTQGSILTPTTFNSLRTSIRVMSTYYPNRMQDVTMKFGNRFETTTPVDEKLPEFHQDDEFDEYRDAIDPGFTMEKLAYLLIGTCCGLSVLCLFVVVIAIKCRRSMVEKRLKAQFRKRMYYHEKMKGMATPWQQQMYDHFMYLHRRPGQDSSCSRSTDSCNCRCVTWSLGARNLDSTMPLCSTNRSSSYLCGQKKLPFGAASTLRYESMLGRKRTTPENNHRHKNDSPNTDSSHENDSLDIDSDSREGDGPKQCTCIDYNMWPMPPANVPRGFFTVCPNVGRYNAGNCSQHPPVELRTISKDVPPPVTGSNYLDRSEGVVYWSSNDERLI